MDTTEELKQILDSEHSEEVLKQLGSFVELMMQYRCAMREICTKLEVLNDEFSIAHNRNPIENIESRLKSPDSIVEKLKRKGFPLTVENVEENLNDIAGIRVICSFPEDIYTVADLLIQQYDILLIEKKDYIAHPKPNGYRSLHLIVDIPIFLSKQKKHMRAEVQFRTIAMDFWASLEHKLKYKKDIANSSEIALELKECAEIANALDYRMQEIRTQIETESKDTEAGTQYQKMSF